MYEQFYGLKETPFSLTPDPEFLFVSQDYQSAMEHVLRGIARREGFTVIAGDVGTGKTTLCWAILGKLDKGLKTALILNPMLGPEDMLRAILQDFGVSRPSSGESPAPSVPPDPGSAQAVSRKDLIDELNRFLLAEAQADVFCVLIIDEAQDLSFEVLEQLRLLSNLETSKKKLLQIIFVGQLEFNEKLKARELRSLNQRISTRYELKPLNERDTASYISHRLNIAKAPRKVVFTAGAVKEVYRSSRGYPRLVNLICDRTLLAGYSERSWTMTRHMVRRAAAGLRGGGALPKPRWHPRVPVPLRLGASVAALVLILALLLGWRGHPLNSAVPSAEPEPAAVPEPPHGPQPQAIETRPSPQPEPAPIAESAVPPESKVDPAAAAPEPPAAGQYHVQVHSFLLEEQALSARRQLEGQGFPSRIHTDQQPNGTRWFVVVTGPYDDVESARACAARLKTESGASPIVLRRAP